MAIDLSCKTCIGQAELDAAKENKCIDMYEEASKDEAALAEQEKRLRFDRSDINFVSDFSKNRAIMLKQIAKKRHAVSEKKQKASRRLCQSYGRRKIHSRMKQTHDVIQNKAVELINRAKFTETQADDEYAKKIAASAHRLSHELFGLSDNEIESVLEKEYSDVTDDIT